MEKVTLSRSSRAEKKFMVKVGNKTVHFGAKGYEDYTIHKDYERYLRYINRHKARENWKRSGIETPGFWARWILWNLPNFKASVKDTEKRFNLVISLK
jgi:hypothetical protein